MKLHQRCPHRRRSHPKVERSLLVHLTVDLLLWLGKPYKTIAIWLQYLFGLSITKSSLSRYYQRRREEAA